MPKIITSGLISWNKENIEKTINKPGVFILRKSPISDNIIDLSKTDNLREKLLDIYNDSAYKDINFFDWYSTEDTSTKNIDDLIKTLKKYYVK